MGTESFTSFSNVCNDVHSNVCGKYTQNCNNDSVSNTGKIKVRKNLIYDFKKVVELSKKTMQ